MGEYGELILASALFIGSHFVMSHPLRAPMIGALGEKGFMAVYSIVSLAAFVWMIFAFRAAPTGIAYWAASDAVWISASILTLLAAIFYAGSMAGNPALPAPGAEAMATREPAGMFRVTRHPMMWGFALWGIAHILVAPRMDSFIFVGSIIFLALAGARGQDIKKQKTMGDAWRQWEANTSYLPRLSALPRVGFGVWAGGIVIWALATWAHGWFGINGAGPLRWLG